MTGRDMVTAKPASRKLARVLLIPRGANRAGNCGQVAISPARSLPKLPKLPKLKLLSCAAGVRELGAQLFQSPILPGNLSKRTVSAVSVSKWSTRFVLGCRSVPPQIQQGIVARQEPSLRGSGSSESPFKHVLTASGTHRN